MMVLFVKQVHLQNSSEDEEVADAETVRRRREKKKSAVGESIMGW